MTKITSTVLRKYLQAILLAPILLTSCCSDLNKEEISSVLSNALHVGDSREKIESVLKGSGIDFSFDEKFEHRYSSTIRGKNCFNPFDKSVGVYIYLDKSERMSKIETFYSYTMP